MSLSGTIRRLDKGPLGTVQEVQQRLAEAFPGVRFVYEAQEPPAVAMSLRMRPWFLRLWLAIFGVTTRYPRYQGCFERESGGAVEFYFEAKEPVRSIRTTCYGLTAGLDDNFDRLAAATGWTTVHPSF